jgi:predicted N-acetyltransferase YhbS
MVDEIGILRGADAQLDDIWRLARDVFPVWIRNYGSPKALADDFQANHVDLTAAVDHGGRIIGFAAVSPQRAAGGRFLEQSNWAELRFIAVAEECQGRKIASRLHAAALASATGQGRLGIMASSRSETGKIWKRWGWQLGCVGQHISIPDEPAARLVGSLLVTHAPDPDYPVWMWRALDPMRPVQAFIGRFFIDPVVIADEISRQRSYARG